MYCALDSAAGARKSHPGAVTDQLGPAALRSRMQVEMAGGHMPVLVKEVLELMKLNQAGTPPHYLDCTFGGGGHSRALLESDPAARVTALDRDPEAGARARLMAQSYPGRFQFFDLPFSHLEKLTETGYAGVLFDLGVSSFQLDDPKRGFSFRQAAPADMRLDPRTGVPAAQFLEEASREELTTAIRDAGEEPCWRRVVEAILRARGTGQLARTDTLAELVKAAVGTRPGPPARLHPATRTFQGLRIVLNEELIELTAALPAAATKLAPGGVLAVISFHSLEDRIVKRFMNRLAGRPEHEDDATPAQMRSAKADLLARRPITASEEEQQANPRSRSAKLRAARLLK